MCGCGQGINIRALTKKERNAYLKDTKGCCPFCKSNDIVGGPVEIGKNSAFQSVSCTDCGRDWQDIYTLTGVQETDTEV